MIVRTRFITVTRPQRRIRVLSRPSSTVLITGTGDLVLLVRIVRMLARSDIDTFSRREMNVAGVVCTDRVDSQHRENGEKRDDNYLFSGRMYAQHRVFPPCLDHPFEQPRMILWTSAMSFKYTSLMSYIM